MKKLAISFFNIIFVEVLFIIQNFQTSITSLKINKFQAKIEINVIPGTSNGGFGNFHFRVNFGFFNLLLKSNFNSVLNSRVIGTGNNVFLFQRTFSFFFLFPFSFFFLLN